MRYKSEIESKTSPITYNEAILRIESSFKCGNMYI